MIAGTYYLLGCMNNNEASVFWNDLKFEAKQTIHCAKKKCTLVRLEIKTKILLVYVF